jgi:hypothetical protein
MMILCPPSMERVMQGTTRHHHWHSRAGAKTALEVLAWDAAAVIACDEALG